LLIPKCDCVELSEALEEELVKYTRDLSRVFETAKVLQILLERAEVVLNKGTTIHIPV
jgi:hypothetical protein